MRYIKVLILAIFIFFVLVFFFQNQAALSQQLELTLNLLYLPPMTSIPLPFYFIVIASFFVGCILTLALLVWDRFTMGAKVLKNKWRINSLEKEVNDLKAKLQTSQNNEIKAISAASASENHENREAEAHS